MPYLTPLQDFRFALKELAGLDDVLKLPGFEEVTPDLVDAILEENGRFVEQAIAPLNVPGDTRPPVWNDSRTMPPVAGRDCSIRRPGAARGCPSWSRPRLAKTSRPPAWRFRCARC